MPRPFIFRTRHLDGTCLRAGDAFHIDIHLFTRLHDIAHHFRTILSQFESAGFGSPRRHAALESVEEHPVSHLPLHLVQSGVTSLNVQFLTPTELKYHGAVLHEPHFPALWNNACARLSTLANLYGEQALAIDFSGLCKAAWHVRLVHQDLQHLTRNRRSARTGQVHPLGGFLGTARYEGDLDPFLPCLRAAQWTGIGRQTVWGKGEIALS